MNYRLLPHTDIKVSAITYGAFAIGGWFWGGSDEQDAIRTIETAIDNGVTTIDTAPVYGMGHSENIVGKTIKGLRDKVQILTKFGMVWDIEKGDFAFATNNNEGVPLNVYKYNGKEKIIKECEDSLKRLQTDYIDLYQMHWPDSTTPINETMEAVDILLKQGKIRAVGVCNCPVDLLARAGKIAKISTNQVAYSAVNRAIEKDIVPYCVENGIGILPHTSLQKGLLTGNIKVGHVFNDGDHRMNNAFFRPGNHEQVIKMLEEIHPIAKNRNISLAQLAINWTMQQKAVISVLVGARNPRQMIENVKATTFALTVEEIELIDNAFSKINIVI